MSDETVTAKLTHDNVQRLITGLEDENAALRASLAAAEAERDAFRESQKVFLSSLNKAFGYTVGGPTAPCEFLEEVESVMGDRNAAIAEAAAHRDAHDTVLAHANEVERENARLRNEVVRLRAVAAEAVLFISCEAVSHRKSEQHKLGEPCPVIARLTAALEQS